MFLHNIVNLDLHQAIINKVIYTGKIQKITQNIIYYQI